MKRFELFTSLKSVNRKNKLKNSNNCKTNLKIHSITQISTYILYKLY